MKNYVDQGFDLKLSHFSTKGSNQTSENERSTSPTVSAFRELLGDIQECHLEICDIYQRNEGEIPQFSSDVLDYDPLFDSDIIFITPSTLTTNSE